MALGDSGDIVFPAPQGTDVGLSAEPYLVGFDPEAPLSQPPALPRPPFRIPIVLALSALGALVCSIVAVDHSERLGSILLVGHLSHHALPARAAPTAALPISAAQLASLPPTRPTDFDFPPAGFSLGLALNSFVEANKSFVSLPALAPSPGIDDDHEILDSILAATEINLTRSPRTHLRHRHHAQRTARLNFLQRIYFAGLHHAKDRRIVLAMLTRTPRSTRGGKVPDPTDNVDVRR